MKINNHSNARFAILLAKNVMILLQINALLAKMDILKFYLPLVNLALISQILVKFVHLRLIALNALQVKFFLKVNVYLNVIKIVDYILRICNANLVLVHAKNVTVRLFALYVEINLFSVDRNVFPATFNATLVKGLNLTNVPLVKQDFIFRNKWIQQSIFVH